MLRERSNSNMARFIWKRAALVIAFAIAAGVTSSAQQRSTLVASLPHGTSMEFVRIPPGEFMMGCSPGDNQCFDDEKPAHPVRITRGFEMAKYEVTEAQWQAVMVSSPLIIPPKGENYAYGFVGFALIQEFLDRLNARNDGYRYRLPTEAEWEYAARAGSTRPVAGSSLDEVAWYGQNVTGKPYLVGQKKPNAWGLYDMHGNVWEWVQDYYDARYYTPAAVSDPKGPASGQYRVLRGGSCFTDARRTRVSVRSFVGIPISPDFFGFRCVREPIR
jgi:formylglycine-generating enzyme required for sulfatase activity